MTRAPRLAPEPLQFDEHGNPFSRRYGDAYASRDGAWGQAQHVFLSGNELPQRWSRRAEFTILETGFGLGTNFLASWAAWRDDPQRPGRLHFLSIEAHPLRSGDLLAPQAHARAHADAPALRAQLAAQWPLPLAGLHRLEFEGGRLVLTLALGDAREIAPQLLAGVDAFFLDGFAPDRNPQMWEPRLMRALGRLARPGATAATYTCARAVRDALVEAGFGVERAPGFGRKRDMLRARFAPRWPIRRHEPRRAYEGTREAIVVGAGLAGCSTAYALRRRGWNVALLDRSGTLGGGASALPAGLLRPLLSADDNAASRLVRAGTFFSWRLLQAAAAQAPDPREGRWWAPCGVFHEAASAHEDEAWRSRLARLGWPPEFAVHWSASEAHAQLGLRPRHGGTWFAHAGVVAPRRWCGALATRPGDTGPACRRFAVQRIEYAAGAWRVLDADGGRLEAPVLVIANGIEASGLLPMADAPLGAIPGRVSLLEAPALAALRCAVSGDGFVVPPLLGDAAVGATYDTDPAQAGPAEAAHEQNLARLARLLEHESSVRAQGVFGAVRCASRDRMPLGGELGDETAVHAAGAGLRGAHLPDLPRRPGLFCLLALGSRGLALAPLLGEHVASAICGEPAPIEAPLSAAVDPARFLLRRLRGAADGALGVAP